MPARTEPYDAPAIVTFAKELEWQRTKAGLTKKDLAAALGFVESYVGQVELCKNLPSEDFADALDTYFKTDGYFRRLRDRILETRHYSVVPPGFPDYLKHETRATSVRNFSPILINGLLQIEDYARAVVSDYQPADVIEQLVRDRLQRQEILDQVYAYFTMDEAVLHRIVGSREIMYQQLESLLKLSEQPNISIEVIPSAVGFYPGVGGEFTMLGFEEGGSIAYTESWGEGLLIQDPARIARHVIRYDSARGHALPVDQSRKLIRDVKERLGEC